MDDNDPDRYAAYIASRLAVPITYPMWKIVDDISQTKRSTT